MLIQYEKNGLYGLPSDLKYLPATLSLLYKDNRYSGLIWAIY